MSADNPKTIHGRGTPENPANRFEQIHIERDPENPRDPGFKPDTIYLKDNTKSLITYNDSPDVGFEAGINPYRGCEHGCVYCFARPSHEYFGLSSGLDFETKIFVKENAPKILAKELSARQWRPRVLALSGNTDCYQPVERRLRLTRRCLEVLADFRNPVVVITKNHLVTRDIDILKQLAGFQAVKIFISVTTLDAKLANILEPRASCPADRLDAIKKLSEAGVPAGVLVAPVIPGLTDHEMPRIIAQAARHGARSAGHVILRLPYAVKGLFEHWLEAHFPERKNKVLNRIREIRGGSLNDPRFGHRMKGEGPFAKQIHDFFYLSCKKEGLNIDTAELSTSSFRKPSAQLTLFDEQPPA
jgi:DNA repair photolyase